MKMSCGVANAAKHTKTPEQSAGSLFLAYLSKKYNL